MTSWELTLEHLERERMSCVDALLTGMPFFQLMSLDFMGLYLSPSSKCVVPAICFWLLQSLPSGWLGESSWNFTTPHQVLSIFFWPNYLQTVIFVSCCLFKSFLCFQMEEVQDEADLFVRDGRSITAGSEWNDRSAFLQQMRWPTWRVSMRICRSIHINNHHYNHHNNNDNDHNNNHNNNNNNNNYDNDYDNYHHHHNNNNQHDHRSAHDECVI